MTSASKSHNKEIWLDHKQQGHRLRRAKQKYEQVRKEVCREKKRNHLETYRGTYKSNKLKIFYQNIKRSKRHDT